MLRAPDDMCLVCGKHIRVEKKRKAKHHSVSLFAGRDSIAVYSLLFLPHEVVNSSHPQYAIGGTLSLCIEQVSVES